MRKSYEKKMNEQNEINEDEVFEKQESKVKLKMQHFFKNKRNVILSCIVILVIVLVVLQVKMGIFSFGKKLGNTPGNISNCGYSVAKDDYIYYVAPSDSMETTNIYKAKKGTTDFEKIYDGNYDIRALNVVGNKIYFITLSYDEATEQEDSVDNKICKMNLDGSNLEIINDNEFAYDYYDMYVVNNKIYYVGEDLNVYKMNTNGSNRELIVETGTGYLALNEKYIIYNKPNEDDTDYITYIASLNGKNERQINGSRINTPVIDNGYIYYLNDNQNIARISLDGGDEEVILNDSAYNMNLYGENIYYLNYKDEKNSDYTVCIYKVNVNGGEPEIVKELSYYASFLDIVDGYIYYMDMDEEKAFINLINTSDSSENILYEWKYDNDTSAGNATDATTEEVTTEN